MFCDRTGSGLSVLGLATALLITAACGEDKGDAAQGPGDGDDLDTEIDGGEEEPTGDKPPTSIDSGVGFIDASVGVVDPPASDDASTGVDVAPDGAVVTPLPPVTDVPLVPLPVDGTRLAACYSSTDCQGDDLVCVSPTGPLGAGFCMEDCSTDTDCPVVDGVQSTCSVEGECRFDCTGEGRGDGACPTNMVCRNLVPVGVRALPLYRCTYPLGAGAKSVPAYGQCDNAHGNGDCAGAATCRVPVAGIVTPPAGPGYCAPSCTTETVATDCAAPAGSTVEPVCDLGWCEFDCSGMGSVCPSGMDCRDVDQAPLISQFRCRFIAAN
jgi:hypothetical protein